MASTAFSIKTIWGGEVAYRGSGTVSGTVHVSGSNARRRVRVYDRNSGILLAQTWSDSSTGAYSFSSLSTTNKVFVVVDDHNGNTYNAVIYDMVQAA